MVRVLAFLALLAIWPAPSSAYNFFGGTVPSGSGGSGSAPCSGTTYQNMGTSGSSPTITLAGGSCIIYLDSGSSTDTFATVTIVLPSSHTDGVTDMGFITTRAISTVQFQDASGDTTPIYANGTTATSLSSVPANQTFQVAYTGGAAHVQLPATVIGSGNGGGSGGSGNVVSGGSGTYAIASGAGSGIGAGQAARVADLRNIEGVNLGTWWSPDETTGPSGGPFLDPETRQNNCAYANGLSTASCVANSGCTKNYDDVCYPNQDAAFIYMLNYLGVKHARTWALNGTMDRLLDLVAHVPGLTFDAICYIPGASGQNLTAAQCVQGTSPIQSSIESFEGQNEPDQSSSNKAASYDGQTANGPENVAFTTDEKTAMSNYGYGSTPLLGPSITINCTFDGGGNYGCFSAYYNMATAGATVGNMHDYMSSDYITRSGVSGGDEFAENLSHQASVYSPNPTTMTTVTETGAPTNPYGTGWGLYGAVDAVTAAKFDVAEIFQAWNDHIRRVFWYQTVANCYPSSGLLADAQNNADECEFGLFDNSYVPKASATEIHNLNTILTDTGSTAATFATGTLNYTISGLPSTSSSFLFEDSTGAYYIVINNQPANIWAHGSTTTQGTENTISSSSITVSFGQTFASAQVYNVLTGTSPTATGSSVSSMTTSVAGDPVIIKVHN